MPVKKRKSHKQSRRTDDDRTGETESEATSEENESVNISTKELDPDSIEYKIMNTKHPFEKLGLSEPIKITPSQKAITCCIQINGGAADEEILLSFIQSNWNFIKKLNSKPKSMPDARILHINLKQKKKNMPLFIHDETNDKWMLNTVDGNKYKNKLNEANRIRNICNRYDESTESNSDDFTDKSQKKNIINYNLEMKQKDSFENLILQIVRENKESGISKNEIIEKVRGFEYKDGLFKKLPLERRVHGCLLVLCHESKIFKDKRKDGVYSSEMRYVNLKDDYRNQRISLPDPIKNLKISELSLDQLWVFLNQNKIYDSDVN